jgi:hypothetical protein
MTGRKLEFNPISYRKYWQWRLGVLYGISAVIDLVVLWLMVFDAPDIQLAQEVSALVWYIPLIFLLLVSTAGIAGYSTYRYLKFRKLRALSYVTLQEGAVVHYIQEPFISKETARLALEGKRLRDESIEFYAAYLKFSITEVTKLRYNWFGAIVLEGVVERMYHDEYLQEDEGGKGPYFMTVKKHKIPAYFDDMEALVGALETLRMP